MEFEGFSFNANQFLALPGLNENKEVLAVLKHSPQTVVGANKPFIAKQTKQMKVQKQASCGMKKQKYEYNDIIEQEQQQTYQIVFDFEEQQAEEDGRSEIMNIWKGVHQKRWFFIGGDLYINLDVFSREGQKQKEAYSHWNEWRPHSNIQGFKNYIQLNMRTDNEAPQEFSHVINYLQSMQIKEAFQVSNFLQKYSMQVKQELDMCRKVKSYCEDHFEHLQDCLAENYSSSLSKASEILNGIGQEYPFVYFIRRNNYRSLRMQVSSIGFNYVFTEILCENRDHYLQSLQRNGFQEVFSNYTHYQLLMMNLLQQNEAEIEIVTVDDIVIPCKIKAISYDLTTFKLVDDIKFTNSLRIYKFEIDDKQLKRVAKIRAERPLQYEEGVSEFQYNFVCDQFLQQYYNYFAYQKNQSSNYLKQKLSIAQNSESDKLNLTTTSNGSSALNSTLGDEFNIQGINQNQLSQESSSQNLQDILNQPSIQQQIQLQNISQPIQNNLVMQTLQNNVLQQQQHHQHQQLQPILTQSLIQQNKQQLLINNPNLSQQCTNETPNMQLQQQQNILDLINCLQTNQFQQQQQQQQQQLIISNTQLQNQQQIIIPPSSVSLDQFNLNNILLYQSQQQTGVNMNKIDQQQQIDFLTQIQQQNLVQQTQQQEIESLNELRIALQNEQVIQMPLYIQLKQLQLNYEINQQLQQLQPLNNVQLQYIATYEQNQQLLNYVQIKINQMLVQLQQ